MQFTQKSSLEGTSDVAHLGGEQEGTGDIAFSGGGSRKPMVVYPTEVQQKSKGDVALPGAVGRPLWYSFLRGSMKALGMKPTHGGSKKALLT